MKRIIKIVGISAMMLVIMTGLTGCSKFEQLRQSQAMLRNEKTLIFQNEKYRLLPQCEYLKPDYSASNDTVYLVSKDTPVLLSSFLGNRMEISKDKMFLAGDTGSGVESYVDYKTFCHEDYYDEILSVIEKGYEPNGYKVKFYDWKDDEMKEYLLSDEEVKAVESVLNLPPAGTDMKEIIYHQTFSIFSCMKGIPFSEYAAELLETDSGYYFEKYNDETQTAFYYKVPDELSSIFEKLVDRCMG